MTKRDAPCMIADMARNATTSPFQREEIDRGRPIPHGTLNGYVNYKCSCGECKGAKADYERDQRAKSKALATLGSPLVHIRGRSRVRH